MTIAERILEFSTWFALAVLSLAVLLTVWRVVRGPALPDRVIALDMLVGIVIGFIALVAIRTGFTLYIDIAIALALVGFLATVAFARFILARGRSGDDPAGTPRTGKRMAETSDSPETARRKPGGKSAGATRKGSKR